MQVSKEIRFMISRVNLRFTLEQNGPRETCTFTVNTTTTINTSAAVLRNLQKKRTTYFNTHVP
jgi:hypothetical protein